MTNKKLFSISLFSIFAFSSAQSQEVQLELPIGVQSQVPLQIKLPSETGKCNIEISVPGQAKFEREVNAPNFQASVDFTPPGEGSFPIEWKGKLKKRGLNSVLGCDGAGKVLVTGKPSASDIAAKWSDYFSKSKTEAVECVRLGLEINQVLFESTDPAAKLVTPNDSSVKPIFEKCDSFFRARQPQQNFACTIQGGIKTFCNNLYAERGVDGRLKAISKTEAIKLHFSGKEWSLGNVETEEAKSIRLKAEEDNKNRQLADAARSATTANSTALTQGSTSAQTSNATASNNSKTSGISAQRPPNPTTYGRCYGSIFAWTKKSSGQITNQRAVDFFNSWQPYAGQVSSTVAKAGGCAANYNASELLQCYEKRLPDERDAKFLWSVNNGSEPVMDANILAAEMLTKLTCGELIGYVSKPTTSSAPSSSSSAQQVTRLECNTNVNCNDKNDILNKLRSVWIKFNSPSEPAKSYADICFEIIKNVQSFPAGMPLGPNVISLQLNHCNDAIAQIQRMKQ